MSRWLQEAQLALSQKILIRVDTSLQIGTGHLMRCLALANEAKRRDYSICFVLRDPDPAIIEYISSFCHEIRQLNTFKLKKFKCLEPKSYLDWLIVSPEQDAQETLNIIHDFIPNWIIVDHYALDDSWFKIIQKCEAKVLAIDDLGNRNLICDFLLDQNLGAGVEKYNGKVSEDCKFLFGPSYALLRDEFRQWREHSLKSRIGRRCKKILITMGGVDEANFTLNILKQLKKSIHARNCEFTVIVGMSYPHMNTLNSFIRKSALKISVLSNVSRMADIMASSDLCIGAAGSTSWERCCLGLPTITLAIADNQIDILTHLDQQLCTIASSLDRMILDFGFFFGEDQGIQLQRLSTNSAVICDGKGTQRVLDLMEQMKTSNAV